VEEGKNRGLLEHWISQHLPGENGRHCRRSKWLPTANGIGFGELTPYLFYHKQHHCVHIASYTAFT
jgi:hypothetical protein